MACQGGDLIAIFSNENVDFMCISASSVANLNSKRSGWNHLFKEVGGFLIQPSFVLVLKRVCVSSVPP